MHVEGILPLAAPSATPLLALRRLGPSPGDRPARGCRVGLGRGGLQELGRGSGNIDLREIAGTDDEVGRQPHGRTPIYSLVKHQGGQIRTQHGRVEAVRTIEPERWIAAPRALPRLTGR